MFDAVLSERSVRGSTHSPAATHMLVYAVIAVGAQAARFVPGPDTTTGYLQLAHVCVCAEPLL